MEPAVDWAASARPLAPGEFDEIRRLARRTFGLDLKPGKEQLVAARLGRLMRGGGFHSYRQLYRRIVEDTTGESLAALIDALATNHTAFLREPDHFTFLRERVFRRSAGAAGWTSGARHVPPARRSGRWLASSTTSSIGRVPHHRDRHIAKGPGGGAARGVSVRALRYSSGRLVIPLLHAGSRRGRFSGAARRPRSS